MYIYIPRGNQYAIHLHTCRNISRHAATQYLFNQFRSLVLQSFCRLGYIIIHTFYATSYKKMLILNEKIEANYFIMNIFVNR